jgi:capsular polysaccharide transport system ATP-binding protein
MLELRNVTKSYKTQVGEHRVLDDINLTVDHGEKVGILGLNGSGKSTLIRLIGDVEPPTSGHIHRGMSISWPLAFQGGFQTTMTGVDNLRFICRIYDTPIEPALEYVKYFSDLGEYLNEPVKTYSAGMFQRLSFAISMAIDFDCYLIDETLAVGDQRFQQRCNDELFGKRGDRSMIIVSHIPAVIKEHCDSAFVLIKGKINKFDNVDDAYDFYNEQIAQS